MKKVLLLALTIAMVPALCSCEVHFFDLRYDVPWWVIAIPTAIIIIFAFVIGGIVLSKNEYICQHCNHKFKPKWYKAGFSIHLNDDRIFKCPRCKNRGFCKMSRKNKKD